MNLFTEETVPAYSNLGLTTNGICNYKVGHVSWGSGESPSDHHENCDTPFTLFHSHSMEDKLPTLCVRLQGAHRSVGSSMINDTMIFL